MDLTDFLSLLEATPVVSDADKAKHRERAASYSPALRSRMAGIITEEEERLVERHRAAKDAARRETGRRMSAARELEERERSAEIAEARNVADSFATYV